MCPPDQILNLQQQQEPIGSTVYFWNGRSYSRWVLKSKHTFESALTIENGIGPMIVKPTECISEEIYLAEKLADDTEKARQRYAEIIKHWNNGLRTSKEIAPLIAGMIVIGEPVSVHGCGRMIAAAKRWKLITDDPTPSDSNSSASG